MNQQRAKTLFEQYLNETLPPEDIWELKRAIHDDRFRVLFDELLKNAFKDSSFEETDDDAKQAVLNILNLKISQQNEAELGKNKQRRLIPFRWLAGAAALLFIALGAGWLFLHEDKKEGKQNTYSHNIRPGGNRATLTLSNGKKLILTDALNGQLANESGVQVNKTKQGEIVYMITSRKNSAQQALPYNTLTTKRGEQFQVVLPDGSHVWLDAVSSLRYPVAFSGNERKVELTGQGYFEVTHNAAMPFIVKTAKTEVQVLGTHFNVSAYDDASDDKTTLLEGSVKVKSSNSTALLKPGDQAVSDNNGHLNISHDVDVEQETAWKNGLFIFKGAGIQEIMAKASRWYDIDVIYKGNIPKKRLNGRMSREVDISELLGILQFEGIKFRMEGKNLVITD